MTRTLARIVAVLVAVLALLPMAGAATAAPGAPAAMPALEMVPLRAVAEATGATVTWDATAWAATVVRGDVTLVVKIGEGTGSVNGVALPVGAPVALENGRTMLPLSFLKAVLGVEVSWDGAAGKAVVDKTATRAMDFLREMAAGKFDPDSATPTFRTIRPAPVVAGIAAQLKQIGGIGQISLLSHTRTAVHENVRILAVMGMTPMELTVRFTPDGLLIDDYYMNAWAGPAVPAGPAAYVNSDAFTEKDVVIGEGSPYPLPGTVSMPKGQGPFPLVVLVHGSGPNDRDVTVGGVKTFRDLAQGLASKGVAVLRYEKRTREHSQKTVLVPNFGLRAETIDDALLAAKYAAGLDGIDPHRIFVLGHSQGGYAIPRIIDLDTEKLFAGAMIAAGPSDFLQALLDQNKLMVDAKQLPEAQWPFIQQQVAMLRDPKFNPQQPPQGYALGTPGYWLDLRDPVSPLAAKQSLPLFILQGGRDFQVPASHLETWQKELANRDGVTYKLYPKLNHIFTEGEGPMGWLPEYQTPANVPAYVIDDIAAWVQKH